MLSAALVAMGMARRGEQRLQSARLAVVDVDADGGGWQQESVAYVGADDPDMTLRAARRSASCCVPRWPMRGNRPTVRQQPFAVDNAGVFAERIERVWEAAGPRRPADSRSPPSAQFGAGRTHARGRQRPRQPLASPLLVWNGRALSMADLPPGARRLRARCSSTRAASSPARRAHVASSRNGAAQIDRGVARAGERADGDTPARRAADAGRLDRDDARSALVRAASTATATIERSRW